MSGRLERDQKIENKINSIIKDQPIIIKEYSNSFGNKTSTTKKSYICHAIDFLNFLEREYNFDINDSNSFKKLNYIHINAYMNYTKTHTPDGKYIVKEAGTCAAEFYSIKHFCRFLVLCKYVDANPCNDVEVPKDKKKHDIVSLTPEEISIIKDNINKGVGTSRAKSYQSKMKSRDLCIVMLGITTGLRVSAISNIDIDDIDFKNNVLRTIEKGGYEREIFLSDKLVDIINNWIVDRKKILGKIECNALFISTQKKRIGITTIRSLLTKYTYNISKHITPHKLRSTTAINLYDTTGDIFLVADVLGHHNIENTKRYTKVSNAKRKYAADKLSNLI